ncbi:MAG: SIR2 family protein [Truepera sp.]|nr:SIR2 family protein [Truepera sp.]
MSKRLLAADDRENRPKLAPDTPPKLAQKYETAFQRPGLYHFLQQQIRDEDFRPGDKHTRLLNLPWRDVFTTNWDRLLERTQVTVQDRTYSVVRNKAEIPPASQPRIIKLHGSFPAQKYPLIVTEEDYRTYPKKFAPFVNTVRQAMMETVFFLIGFSGDDPNFLHWSGWIRDHLEHSAPRIYLAGYLNLSSNERRTLEGQNIFPIDLAGHPKAKAGEWPKHLQHDYATEWILYTLEYGRPYDVTEWPSPRSWQYPPIPKDLEDLKPVVRVASDEPKCEPEVPHQPGSEDLLNFARQTIEVWSHNRRIYPGWLVIPFSTLRSHCPDWIAENRRERLILQALPKLEPVERLNVIRELTWRREVRMEPISHELESEAVVALGQINCCSRTIKDKDVDRSKVEWVDVREAWREVAVGLVTAARHRFDRKAFDQRIKDLQPFRRDDPKIDHRIHHELCLWAIYSLDFEKLEGLLKDWQTENCDPVWMMCKAAILAEANRIDDAYELFKRALSTIRQSPDDPHSVAGPSREGWALWLAMEFDELRVEEQGANHSDTDPDSDRRRRWRELAPLKCDALSERRDYIDEVEPDEEKKDAPPFDLDDPGVRYLRFSFLNPRVSARRAVRLCEVAGLPPLAASYILKRAARKLSTLEQKSEREAEREMALRLALRSSGSDRESDSPLPHLLTRSRLANMPADLARTLANTCARVIKYGLPRMMGGDARADRWMGKVSVAMEVLSRLVLRLKTDRIEVAFDKALEYYRDPRISQTVGLERAVKNMLKRSWEVLPEERRAARVLDLLDDRAPIVGLDSFEDPEPFSRYPDPGDLLQDKNTLPRPDRTSSNESQWQEIVRRLIRGLEAGGAARERASRRLMPVAFWGQLTEDESSRVAQALWSENYTDPDDIPRETSLCHWKFLLLPEPELGLAEQRFRHKWLAANSAPQAKEPSLDDVLWQVGSAISGLKAYQHPLDLSEDERSYLAKVVEKWSDTPVSSHFEHVSYEVEESVYEEDLLLRNSTRPALHGLSSILAEVTVSEAVGGKLFEKLQGFGEYDIPGFRLIPGLTKAMPSRLDELVSAMRMGLVSNNAELATSSLQGLRYWLEISGEKATQVEPPPDDLVRETGLIIATRRKMSLEEALVVAKRVFDCSDSHREPIAELTLQGLGYLAEELRYDRAHDQDSIDAVPRLRWRCAQLVSSMEKHGYKNHPVVVDWLKIVKDDPLPEVRNTRSPVFTRQSEDGESMDDGPSSHTK